MNLIKPLINIDELILIAKQHHNKTRYYNIKHYRHCFTGNYENDIKNANEVIDKTLNHNTANNREHSFKWGFDQLYENEFNHKHIHHRPNFPSHFTTRLDKNEINFIKAKFEEYIKYDHLSVLVNKWNALKYSHLRIYHCFLTLIQSGMRVGELVSIDFRADPGRRQMHSILHKDTMVEIVINTLKTKKKREIYVPLASYNFFKNDKRKLSRDLVIDGFTTFARWAKLPMRLTAHVCRRTLASLMHEAGVDVYTIAMTLGNTPGVVMNHYILSSGRNFDAVEIAIARMNGSLVKKNNMYVNSEWMDIKASDKHTS